jgi:hypothetical protein
METLEKRRISSMDLSTLSPLRTTTLAKARDFVAALVTSILLAHGTIGAVATAAATGDVPGTGAGGGASSSSSNASNYQSGTQLSVSSRTGGVSIQAQLVEIPGIVSETSLTLGLSYRSEDAVPNGESGVQYFGLPYGWRYNISFIDTGQAAGTYRNLYLEGNQSYIVDENWHTQFTPAGASQPIAVKTGLLLYNRADANFRTDDASVTVGGIPSAFVYATLDGMSRYFSANGLELRMTDRFGNHVDYFYDADTNPRNARVEKITDSWGHDVVFSYCEDETCTAGEVTITLPDGRTVGFVAPSEFVISDIIDAEGKRTHLTWTQSPCQHGQAVLEGMTSASGGMTSLVTTCLNVCTQPSANNCQTDGNATTWPVVETVYECPNNASGTKCPDGSPGADFLTTQHFYELTGNPRNYTGFPLYSPYAPTDPLSDALMSSNDTAFTYTTVTSTLSAGGTVIYQNEDDYNFLHLQSEQRIYVRARQQNGQFGLSLSKEKSFCYSASSGGPTCPLDADDYQNLPANYQAATITGSCVYDIEGGSGQARRSVTTRAYDGFGNTVNSRTYHASGTEGVVSGCDRSTRLSTSGLRLVADDYAQFDTPSAVDSDSFLSLGTGSKHYGLVLGQQSFFYLDDDEEGVHGTLGATEGPVLVKLACYTLTSDAGAETAGTQVKQSSIGLMSNDTPPPTTPGIIEACQSPSWDPSVAPPKTTTLSYDAAGRALSHTLTWTEGYESPGGVTSSSGTISYSLIDRKGGEEECGEAGSNSVLEIATTDDEGDTTVNRVCTLNGFHVANVDARGNRTRFDHTPTGLVSRITHPNGTYNKTDYYHVCPLSQDGHSPTCAASVTQDCPFDTMSPPRNCMVESVHAGTDPVSGEPNTSYLDGVKQITIKDGLGRVVAKRDDTGAGSSGYNSLQTRSESTYNSVGLISSSVTRMGATDPLIYTATVTYGPKLRPVLGCGPRGDSMQVVHDDVNLRKLKLSNGNALETYTLNDSHKLATIADCDLVAGPTAAAGGCPTTAADATVAACPADAFYTYTLHDGAGQEHSMTTSAGAEAPPGTTVTSLNGIATYSADLLKYGYTYGGGDGAQQVTANSEWVRDLHGQLLKQSLTVTTQGGTTSASTDANGYNQLGLLVSEQNNLDPSLVETYAYTPTGKMSRNTSYQGVDFYHYYDSMDRAVRYCFASEDGGSEGESFLLDAVTGAVLTIQHFTNPTDCGDCGAAVCPGDVPGNAVHYAYARFGAVESIVYSDEVGAELQYAYDKYQRPVCVADAMATASGSSCPTSPVADDFQPAPDALLVTTSYWPDDDPYRRGLVKSQCRGVRDASGAYVTRCLDTDYYTAVDVGGSCAGELASVVGAYSGQVKAELYCAGGSCLDGAGTPIYRSDYLYDDHRRPCSIEMRNAAGSLIRGTTFTYDQYDQVLSETHSSDLDPSDESNYRVSYVYDGLLRVTGETRTDLEDSLIEQITYAYDARSNLVEKVEQRPAASNPGPDPTVTPTATTQPTTVTPEPTTAAPQPTPTATTEPTPTQVSSADEDDGCAIQGRGGSGWILLLPLAVLVLRRRRRSTVLVDSPTRHDS